MTRVLVVNGPNLSRLGSREPEVYGALGLAELTEQLHEASGDLTVEVRQSDNEAELVGWMHEAVDTSSSVILNPAAFTHYSYALRDAVAMVTDAGLTLVEVHITNPHARETFRHTSVISGVATGVIAGFGFESYLLALELIRRRSN